MSFIERFKDATIGFSGYPRLLRDRGGFGYMALLLLIVMGISAALDTMRTKDAMADMAADFAAGPYFALEGGKFRYDGPMPATINFDGGVVIIDTSGQTSPDVLRTHGSGSMLITQDTLYQNSVAGQAQAISLRTVPMDLTRDDIAQFLQKLYWMVPLVYGILLYPAQLAFKALDAVILALIATLLLGSGPNRKVPFDLGFKAGIYAMTLSTVVQWIAPGFTTLAWPGFALWWGISILYLVMGLNAYYAGDSAA